ncbi:MAG: Zn-ribbon domain-containing OB-fold protein, partial [Desulfobacterales bacterium]|nr:Zn-ribbon domain-containing OB-fold protein [Desulfobacterales bacterium]
MEVNFSEVTPMIYESGINVPYHWWAGKTATRFYTVIRDESKIMATTCRVCKQVFVPPRKVCPACFVDADQWIEVSSSGTILTYTIARRQLSALPKKVPVIFALIQLDGATTSLLHYVDEIRPEDVKIGLRVKAKFSANPVGGIMDIDYFRPIEE